MGERRIGIAVSDPEGRVAVPLRILQRAGASADEQALADLARAEGIEAFVVGLPRSLDGSIGPQARRVQSFAGRLGKATGLPVRLWDERLTTVQARRTGGKKRRAPVDDLAAALILQSYLDRQRSGGAAGAS